MDLSISLSPDGRHILSEQLVEPFSYIVGYTSFGRDLKVLDLDGRIVSMVRQVPLHEPAGRDNRPDADLPREVTWRPNGRGLSWLDRAPNHTVEEGETTDPESQDRVMTVEAPFVVAEAQVLAETEGRFSDLRFSADGSKFFLEDLKDGERRILAYNLSTGSPVETELARYDPDEVIALPGELLTRQDVNGITSTVTSSDGTSVYLSLIHI